MYGSGMWRYIGIVPHKVQDGFVHAAKRILLICLAAVISAANMNTFIRAGDLFPGGFTGLALLIQHTARNYFNISLPFSPIVLVLNAVPVIIAFKFIGKWFTLYSCLMVVLSSVLVDIFPSFNITDDVLLSAVFGGLISAFAGYLCLRAKATGGGTDLIAIFISERCGKDAWNYMFAFNAAILCAAGFLFGWERALYSIFFQFTATQLIHAVYKRYQKATLLVITNKSQEIYAVISELTHHDATLFKGSGCYQGAERDMLYSVVSGDEVRQLTSKIKEIDAKAFVNILHSEQVLGRFYMRPND